MTRVTRRTRKGTRKVRRSMDVQASKRNCAIPVIISPGSVTFRCCDDVCNDAERDISARLFGVIELDETFRDQVNIRRIGGYYLRPEYFLILFPLSLSILQLLTIFLRIATRWSRNSMITRTIFFQFFRFYYRKNNSMIYRIMWKRKLHNYRLRGEQHAGRNNDFQFLAMAFIAESLV